MLLDGGIEQTLHSTMLTHALDNVALQSMLGGEACWLEPLDVVRVVEHVFDGGMALVHSNWVAG